MYSASIKFGDINADGYPDVVARGIAGVLLALNDNGRRFLPARLVNVKLSDASGFSSAIYGMTLQIGPVNDDARDDLWIRGPDGGMTFLSTGNSLSGIEITSVPPLGTSGSAEGRVVIVGDISAQRVAVYIRVPGWGWVSKPYLDNPYTTINPATGVWRCLIATGGNDTFATEVVAFLFDPTRYQPPIVTRADALPGDLDRQTIGSFRVSR